jgi:DNA invertase Pin-like site-specific DNA recombinase
VTKSKSKTLGLVVRVSRVSDRAGERFISPGDQLKEGTRYAGLAGYDVQVFDADAQGQGVSGATPYDDRPGMSEALKLVESGKLAGIVVCYLDRLVREDADKGTTLKSFQRRIRQAGAVLVVGDTPDACIDDPDADEIEGWAAVPLKVRLMMDSAQREESRKKWKKARRNAALRGVSSAPTTLGHGRDENGRLYPLNDASTDAVREAFRMRTSGKATDIQIVEHLNANCPPPKKLRKGKETSGKYNRSFVRQMLANPVYVGHVPNPIDGGYVTTVKLLPDGEIVPATDERDGVLQTPHLPLVDEITFRRAQQGRGRRGPVARRARGALGDVMFCEHGHHCTLDRNARTSFYRCGNPDVHKGSGTIAQPTLENFVVPQVIDYWLGLGLFSKADTAEDRSGLYQAKVDEARADLADAESLQGKVKPAALAVALSAAQEALDAALDEQARYTPDSPVPPKAVLLQLKEAATRGDDVAVNEQLRSLANRCIAKIEYRPGRLPVEEKVDIYWIDPNSGETYTGPATIEQIRANVQAA